MATLPLETVHSFATGSLYPSPDSSEASPLVLSKGVQLHPQPYMHPPPSLLLVHFKGCKEEKVRAENEVGVEIRIKNEDDLKQQQVKNHKNHAAWHRRFFKLPPQHRAAFSPIVRYACKTELGSLGFSYADKDGQINENYT